MYSHGKMNFIVGLCEQLKLPEVFNKNLEKALGRKTDIPYGIIAEMMLVNICDDHHPLYRLNEYYQMKDLEGIFNYLDLWTVNNHIITNIYFKKEFNLKIIKNHHF